MLFLFCHVDHSMSDDNAGKEGKLRKLGSSRVHFYVQVQDNEKAKRRGREREKIVLNMN